MKWISSPGLLLLCAGVHLSCNQQAGEAIHADKPNIIWLVAEDQSPDFFPMYGDSTLPLPQLEKLTSDGVLFANAYSPVPVCAPARSSIITGMYPSTLGTHNMRTYTAWTKDNQPGIGIPSYSPIPPEGVKMFTEYLRESGYYCTNNAKEDYNFEPSPVAWDDSSTKAHWRNRREGQPFFAVFNFGVCHESQVWERGNDSLWVDPLEVPVPPYFPDNDSIRHDLAVNYSNLGRLDTQVGKIIRELKAEGLYENSYIFFYSDHGGPFPRHKRALYETGIKVPMIIKFPANERAGEADDRLLSFIDLAPTILSLTGISPPKVMQGKAQFGEFRDTTARKYLYATADRFDEMYDRLRAVRSGRFKYIRNYNPEISNAMAISYREQMPMMRTLRKSRESGQLDSVQGLWFRTPKPEEELYDLEKDPYELSNLAEQLQFRDTLMQLRQELDTWITDSRDLGRYPEKELIAHWLNDGKQPRLPPLEAMEKNRHFLLRSQVPDATLLWKEAGTSSWEFYQEPLPDTLSFQAKAVRLGYKDSPLLEYEAMP
jgi:arylsulfatase A-like enzyme